MEVVHEGFFAIICELLPFLWLEVPDGSVEAGGVGAGEFFDGDAVAVFYSDADFVAGVFADPVVDF